MNTTPSIGYDGAGNQTKYSPWELGYDAENRIISITKTPSMPSVTVGEGTYAYDGEGRRVKKVWTPPGVAAEETYFVYDPAGNLAAEYGTGPASASGTAYLFADMLGSVRAITDADGVVQECYDHLPFGRLLSASDNGRATLGCHPASPDSSLDSRAPQKFTGQVRDEETRLDYFGARYMSGPEGRFMSIDPKETGPGTAANPQKWNRYAYVLNNPLAFFDPDGKEEITIVYRAFIESASVSLFGRSFGGDGRSFTKDETASSRIGFTLTVETDPRVRQNPLVSAEQPFIGSSIDLGSGEVRRATNGIPQAQVSRDEDGAVVIKIGASTQIPFRVGLLPPPRITPALTITIPSDAKELLIGGNVQHFPSHEINATVNGVTSPLLRLREAQGRFAPVGLLFDRDVYTTCLLENERYTCN